MTTPSAELRTLGAFSLRVDGKTVAAPSTQKARALLVYLILQQGSECSREGLIERFWPDIEPERSRQSLNTAVWSIRKQIRNAGLDPAALFSAGKSTLRWIAPVRSDVATIFAAASDPSSAEESVIELFCGEFLPGDYEEWIVDQRQRIDSSTEKILAHRVLSCADASAAERLLTYDPYHGAAYELLLQTEADAGRLGSLRALVERARAAFEETGITLPENLLRFVGLAASAGASSQRFRLPFVGRQRELAQVVAWLDDQKGAPLFISGAAGIGKSALLSRAAALVLERGFHVVRLQAVENDVRSLGAWQELYERLTSEEFKEFAGLHSGDLAAAVATALLPYLDGSTCLMLDDAQYLEGDAVEVLRLLLRARGPQRILISVRSEAASHLATLLKTAPSQEITLDVLDANEFRDSLAMSLKDSASRAVADAIYARTGGHPLFLISLFEQLAQEGSILGDHGVWELKKTSTLDAIPRTVRRFVDMRLRSCGAAACEVAAALALDPEASPAQLKEVLGMQEDVFLDSLDDLLSFEILVQPDSGPLFAFRHDIEREVAQASLNAARKARLHERFAALLEPFQNRGNALRRSRHFRAARRAREAADQYLIAAEEALEWNAWRDVARIAAEGIDLVTELPGNPEIDALASKLYRVAAHGSLMGGRYDEAIRSLVEAARCGYRSSDPGLGRRADQVYVIACLYSHDYREAQRKADEIIASATAAGQEGPLPMALTGRSCASFFLNETGVAIEDALRAIEIAKRNERTEWIAGGYRTLVQWYGMLWRFPEALGAHEAAAASSKRVNFQSEMSSLSLGGWLEFVLERYANCIAMMRDVQRGLRHGPELQRTMNKVSSTMLPRLFHDALVMEAWAHLRAGSVESAAELLEVAAANSAAYTFPEHAQLVALLRTEVLLAKGCSDHADFAEVVETFDPAVFLREEMSALSHTTGLAVARIACRTGEPGAALVWDAAFEEERDIASRTPLDAPWAFRRLEEAARDAADGAREKRAAAEAAAWETRKSAALAEVLILS